MFCLEQFQKRAFSKLASCSAASEHCIPFDEIAELSLITTSSLHCTGPSFLSREEVCGLHWGVVNNFGPAHNVWYC